MDIKQIREQVDSLFNGRGQLILLWQELAENFYPERADFTLRRDPGDTFVDHLESSYPILVRRDLGDQLGMMLRQTNRPWFHMSPSDDGRTTNNSKRWLEAAEKTMRRAMYDRASRFTRATKEADHDFSCFGQTVISIRLGRYGDTLLYRCWHLRDVVWMEDDEGIVCLVALKWKPTCRELKRMFGSKVSRQVDQYIMQNKPLEQIDCYHIVVASDLFDAEAKGNQYQSIYYECSHEHLLEQVPTKHNEYIIPRWQTVSGSQYAYSPASVVALPDARLIQSMTGTLVESGERLVNPPLVATKDAIRSDVQAFPGGITWVDMEYDERLGPALKELTADSRGLPVGMEMQRDTRLLLREYFYLNKLSMPQRGPEMTAYEVGQRVQEYIRGALPIFEPMEADYNGQLCEMTFALMQQHGAFGSPLDMPAELQGADFEFKFESPLHDAIEEQKGHKFVEMKSLIAEAMALDQSAVALPDIKVALRDALSGIKVPSNWIRDEISVNDIDLAQKAAAQTAQTMSAVEQSSVAAANYAKANKDLAQAA
jgi:hypothetical protein